MQKNIPGQIDFIKEKFFMASQQPLDYYLWNKIRQNMYNQKPANINELKTYIQMAIEEIKQEELFNSIALVYAL